MIIEKIKSMDWETVITKGNKKIHDIHPYFAKFPSEIPSYFIKLLTLQGDTVLDPYCGSGTTLVEAKRLNRNSIGIDANPISCLMSKVKTYYLGNSEIEKIYELLNLIENSKINYGDTTNSISFHNKDYWFDTHVQEEIEYILSKINNINNNKFQDILNLALSRIIVKSSNQQGESRYKRVQKNIKKGETIQMFIDHARYIIESLFNFNSKLSGKPTVKVYNKDTRDIIFLEPQSVNLIVTSPPYLNSWDYGLYHKFRFKWLNLDVNAYEKIEIGRHLRREGDVIDRYKEDMGACLNGFSRVLKRKAYCVIVNANSMVNSIQIDTNQIITECAQNYGLRLIESFDKKVFGPHFGLRAMHKSTGKNSTPSSQKMEQILIFQKE